MHRFTRLVSGALFALSALVTVAVAQTTIPFGSVAYDPKKPIEIVSDSFTLNQTDGRAAFVGNVVAGQGNLRLSADRITVEYNNSGNGKDNRISRLVAQGKVTLVSGAEQAEADRAIYQVTQGKIILDGNVLVTQGKNALSGQKVTIDLASGSARIEGRVKTIFSTGGDN